MPSIATFTESYERRARLYPMLIVLFPFVLSVASLLPTDMDMWRLGGSLILTLSAAALLSQLARDRGKAKETTLFAEWGGKPSERALSFAGGVIDIHSLSRYHKVLKTIDPKLVFPVDQSAELADPDSATQCYQSANRLLLARTRDREKFHLVFEENVNYGFRRNLWAMKSTGIFMAILGLGIAITRVVLDSQSTSQFMATTYAAILVSVCLLVIWIMRVTPSWVGTAANAYAEQLVSATDSISH